MRNFPQLLSVHAVLIEKLLAMWVTTDHSILESVYDPAVVLHYQQNNHGLDEIKRRFHYVTERYSNRSYEITDAYSINHDTFCYNKKSTAIDNETQQPAMQYLSIINKVQYHRITEMWLHTVLPMDFAIKSEELSLNTFDRKIFFVYLETSFSRLGIENNLTARQRDCLYYYLRGYTAKEIGLRLHISHRTVQTHIARLMENFKCKNKSDLINLFYNLNV